jgi:hypothetical protein
MRLLKISSFIASHWLNASGRIRIKTRVIERLTAAFRSLPSAGGAGMRNNHIFISADLILLIVVISLSTAVEYYRFYEHDGWYLTD